MERKREEVKGKYMDVYALKGEMYNEYYNVVGMHSKIGQLILFLG